MATTLKALRQAVGKALRECYVGHVEGASETSLSDTALADLGSATSRFAGGWVKLTSGAQAGTVRGVTDYAPASGQLTLSRSWTTPAAGDEYELHWMLAPEELDQAINEGLSHCPYVREVVLGVVPGQRNYDLSGYPWLTRRPQVRAVFWRQGDPDGEYVYLPVAWWRVREDSGALTLDIRPSSALSDELALQAVTVYDPLESDDATTNCPVDWAKAAAIYEAYRLLTRRGPAQDTARYEAEMNRSATLLAAKARVYAPRGGIVVRVSQPSWQGNSMDIVR